MQEDRTIFKTLADPIQNELTKQGLSFIAAGMMAASLVEAQMSALEARGYSIKLFKKDEQ